VVVTGAWWHGGQQANAIAVRQQTAPSICADIAARSGAHRVAACAIHGGRASGLRGVAQESHSAPPYPAPLALLDTSSHRAVHLASSRAAERLAHLRSGAQAHGIFDNGASFGAGISLLGSFINRCRCASMTRMASASAHNIAGNRRKIERHRA